MTTIETRLGHNTKVTEPAEAPEGRYDFSPYLSDAAWGISHATEYGSSLVTGVTKDQSGQLLADMKYLANSCYKENAFIIDCQVGEHTEEQVIEAFNESRYHLSNTTQGSDKNGLVIVNNLDSLIGMGAAEPTKSQLNAIRSLGRWITKFKDPAQVSKYLPAQKHPDVCAIVTWPERALHPERAELLGSFAARRTFSAAIS